MKISAADGAARDAWTTCAVCPVELGPEGKFLDLRTWFTWSTTKTQCRKLKGFLYIYLVYNVFLLPDVHWSILLNTSATAEPAFGVKILLRQPSSKSKSSILKYLKTTSLPHTDSGISSIPTLFSDSQSCSSGYCSKMVVLVLASHRSLFEPVLRQQHHGSVSSIYLDGSDLHLVHTRNHCTCCWALTKKPRAFLLLDNLTCKDIKLTTARKQKR